MPVSTLPSRELVRQLLSYDPATGEFTWLPRPREMFGTEHHFRMWNTRYAGRPAGNLKPPYLRIAVGHTQFSAHRIAWLYMHGEPVPAMLDHIDCDGLNNRIGNLRAATPSQSKMNQGLRKDNTTGIKGVFDNGSGFTMFIWSGGKQYRRRFRTLEEATKARLEAASRLHGEFARHE